MKFYVIQHEQGNYHRENGENTALESEAALYDTEAEAEAIRAEFAVPERFEVVPVYFD